MRQSPSDVDLPETLRDGLCRPRTPRPAPAGAVETAHVVARHHVTETGDPDGPVMLLAHGFGAGQGAWARLTPHFPGHRVITFDHLGSGRTDMAHFDHDRHASLTGYAEDVLAICEALDLHDVTFVGHSVSSMIGLLAAAAEPERFSSLVLIAPSPRYVDDPATGYTGGFSLDDVHELLASLDSNYYAWSAAMAPLVMGAPEHPELGEELAESFLGTNPDAARTFAGAIFLSDCRDLLAEVGTPALVLQCRQDALAPEAVGRSIATAMPAGEVVVLPAIGHCPHVSAPAETAAAIHGHLETLAAAGGTGARAVSGGTARSGVPAPRTG